MQIQAAAKVLETLNEKKKKKNTLRGRSPLIQTVLACLRRVLFHFNNFISIFKVRLKKLIILSGVEKGEAWAQLRPKVPFSSTFLEMT